jgi:hypothetical protein
MRDQADAMGTHTLRCPRDILNGRRSPLASRHQPPPSWLVCSLMLPCCTSRRVPSMTPRHRSPCVCARCSPACPVRSAPSRRSVFLATTNAPARICPGRRTRYASSYGCASGFAAPAPADVVSSPNACRRWPPPGRAAPCGWPSAWSRSAWRWAGPRGYAWATRGTCGSAGAGPPDAPRLGRG